MSMKVLRFYNIDDVKKQNEKELSAISEDGCEKYSEQWNDHLDKCITGNGEQFARDKLKNEFRFLLGTSSHIKC